MNLQPQLVIVANTSPLTDELLRWLVEDGYQATVVPTFASATVLLRTHPHLVITQLKLREYNGLHVALRAHCEGIPAVVIGEPDRALERDAAQLGATYVRTGQVRRERMLALVQGLIPSMGADRHTASGSGGLTPPAASRRKRARSRSVDRVGRTVSNAAARQR